MTLKHVHIDDDPHKSRVGTSWWLRSKYVLLWKVTRDSIEDACNDTAYAGDVESSMFGRMSSLGNLSVVEGSIDMVFNTECSGHRSVSPSFVI